MQWQAEGLIIGVRRHGETSTIVEAMVVGRGRHLGLVRGGRSKRQAPVLQPGNTVALTWRARLEEHLGLFSIELIESRAADLIGDRRRLYLAQLLFEHLRLLPERDAGDALLAEALALLDGEQDALATGGALAWFERHLLEQLGFGLDLSSCAVTGSETGLTHISPKSGRAVSAEAAEPYRDRLLPMPAFWRDDSPPTLAGIADSLAITGHFLDRHIWSARRLGQPATREPLLRLLAETDIIRS